MKKLIIILMATLDIAIGAMAAEKPAFPGGTKALDAYITNNLKYPQTAKDNGIEGVVAVVFTVKADGTVGNIKIKRMVDPRSGSRGYPSGQRDAEMDSGGQGRRACGRTRRSKRQLYS